MIPKRFTELAAVFLLFIGSVRPAVSSDWELLPYPLFWGGGVQAIYSGFSIFDHLSTRVHLGASGAYESTAFYRYADGGNYYPPVDGVVLNSGEAGYKRLSFSWTAGMEQGILGKREDSPVNAFLMYRGYIDRNFQDDALLFRSGLPDTKGSFLNSLVAGTNMKRVTANPLHGTKQGFTAEFSLEAAPAFLFNSHYGESDFLRFNTRSVFHLTLFDLYPCSQRNTLNLLFSGRTVLDILWGGSIPIAARQSIGGMSTSGALGGSFRGVHYRRFDGNRKFIQNFDLRLNLPSFWIVSSRWNIIPAVGVFTDLAVYDDLTGRIDFSSNRFFQSTGGSLTFNMLGIELGLRGGYFWGESLFSLSLIFGSLY